TDASLRRPPAVAVRAPLRVLQVGRDRRNQAIVALAVRTAPSSVTRTVFISVVNTDVAEATRRIELWGDGHLLEAREIFLDPQARADVSIDDLPRDVGTIEVRLTAAEASQAPAGPPDQLAIDDRAWAVVPPDHLRRLLVVSDGDPYLETALSYLPNSEVYGIAPSDYGADTHPELFDLVVFEGRLPAELPVGPILAIAPTASSPLGEVTGSLDEPGIGTINPDEPLLRYVDLSTVHIATATKLVLPDWARTVIPGPKGTPLLYSGDRAGRRVAVLAFEPRQSDLPLQVAFPILVSNIVGELLGASAGPAEAVAPGTPVDLPIPTGAAGLRVTTPDGRTFELAPPTAGAGSVQFSSTERVGLYTIEALGGPGASPSTAASAGASGPIQSSPSAGRPSPDGSSPSASSPSPVPVDPSAPVRFAVDLFDVGESTIAPGSASALEALAVPPASASPGASGAATPGTGAGATARERPSARDELWVPLLLVILAILFVEWAAYERDALVRFRRELGRRLRRADSAGPAPTRTGNPG
ncbi:MAG TPA: hypothetical protein VIV06_01030, partial [Candidatus Limnocylindrales bacterium]